MRKLIEQNDYSKMEGMFKDKECVIIACGPSLSDHDFNLIKQNLNDKIVFCIKQSYLFFSDICDFHFNNFCNFQDYNLNENVVSCLVWWDKQQQSHTQTFKRADIIFEVNPNLTISKISQIVNESGFKSMFCLDGKTKVYKGPGIMYECVLPMCFLLGFKKITTFGWDIGNNKTDNQHFYNSSPQIKNKIKYIAGSVNGEAVSILNAIPQITKVFKKQDIKIQIISNKNPIASNEVFEKITFRDWISQ